NSTGTTLLAQNNYWGELPPPCPPLPNQISGTVTTSPCLGSPPGGLAVFRELPPLAAAAFGAPSAGASPDLDTEVKQRLIAQYKATISSSPASPEAVEAVRAYYSLVRTDRQDKLKERSQAAGYLQGLASAHASLPLGHSALQLLIIEKNRTGDLSGAIALSHEALTKLPEQEQSGVLFNLVWLTLSAGEVAQAQQLVADFRARFPELASEATHLEETVAEMAPELASMGSSRVMAGKTALPENPGTATARQAPLDELRCFLGFACPRITYNTKASGFAGMRGITR
ncbi:MAG: hypothetical protein ACE5IY_09400, partial [bacterium]